MARWRTKRDSIRAWVLIAAGFIGAVPYLLVLFVLRHRIRRLDAHGLRRLALVLPLLFAFLFVASWFVFGMFVQLYEARPPNFGYEVEFLVTRLSLYAIVIGYGYVVAVLATAALGARFGILTSE